MKKPKKGSAKKAHTLIKKKIHGGIRKLKRRTKLK